MYYSKFIYLLYVFFKVSESVGYSSLSYLSVYLFKFKFIMIYLGIYLAVDMPGCGHGRTASSCFS